MCEFDFIPPTSSKTTPTSKELLAKVYTYLDTIDVTKLSMHELTDFLEVVQKGQFLESFGQMPSFAVGGFNSTTNPPESINADAQSDQHPDQQQE